jgi:hypothetical protein
MYVNNFVVKQVKKVNSFKFLVIIFDSKLTFREHNLHRRKVHLTYILSCEISGTNVRLET